MTLALFDLDNTLIGGDSDHLWGEFLVRKGLVDAEIYQSRNDEFYADYQAGRLDIEAFLAFALEPLARLNIEQLEALRSEYLLSEIEPIILNPALELLGFHREQGHRLVIVTATNEFITRPIATRLGVQDLIATRPEMHGERYTGRVQGVPSFGEGKLVRLRDWMQDLQLDLAGSYFYSDSHNDLPLLEQVSFPVAVDPDATLQAVAEQRGWPVRSLRQGHGF